MIQLIFHVQKNETACSEVRPGWRGDTVTNREGSGAFGNSEAWEENGGIVFSEYSF